jgi:hypothetical protein
VTRVASLGLAVAACLASCPHALAAPAETPASTRAAASYPPLYQAELDDARRFVAEMMAKGVVVPVPRDSGGGYTHEQHKLNYRAIYLAGQLYRITGERAYADFVRDELLAYARLYPTLGPHPAGKNPRDAGRLFWQILNDSVWLVNAVQGYEEVRPTLSKADREAIDDKVFRRMAQFLSVTQRWNFDLIHNHATWATAGVGMTGYLLGDRDLVERALLGSDKSGKAGFLRQIDRLFSPDGYYSEGPYYQRYAIMPFMVFAEAIEHNEPARGIFRYRDGILLKALRTTIELTYDGRFFAINDALKDKSLRTDELYNGVAIAYAQTRDPGLLSIAQWQGHTVLTRDGLLLASDLAASRAEPFSFHSLLLRDGPDGNAGALAVFRRGAGMAGTALVAKNTSQGMGHGHFDKLSWQYFDNGHEIVTDYGAARFLNIEAKHGGKYLPENETWAKQTIAHNTLVVNETSHFGGDVKLADEHAPSQLYYASTPELQVSTASIDSADPAQQVRIVRTLALMPVAGLAEPVVIDVLRASGQGKLRFDLPLHYDGHIMETGFRLSSNVADRPVLGAHDGYQHVWVDATGSPQGDRGYVTWLLDGRFYTYRFVPAASETVVLGETGAHDPEFDLRREPMIIRRIDGVDHAAFVSVLEPHGLYDGAAELTVGSHSRIASLRHFAAEGNDVVVIETVTGERTALAISYDTDPAKPHAMLLDGRRLTWTGFAARIDLVKGHE